MRRYSANYILTPHGTPIRNGIVEVDGNGVVVRVINPEESSIELASTEFHNGIIAPGFINTHCHTELSHLRGKLTRGTGLAGFVQQVRSLRTDTGSVKNDVSEELKRMEQQGTVAVLDICNAASSLASKTASSIRFVNLIEVLGIEPKQANEVIRNAQQLRELASSSNSKGAITPHSTYSLSSHLWELLLEELSNDQVISVHFAESMQEQELICSRTGLLSETFRDWGLPIEAIPKGTPIELLKRYIPRGSKLLLVHSTFLSQADARGIADWFPRVTLSLCPESNLFIEGVLPNIPMLHGMGIKLTIGTDSLASSNTLSMLTQMKIIAKHFPSIPFQTVLEWATRNGAELLNLHHEMGSIEVGKKPGLNLITPFDFSNWRLLEGSRVVRLV